MRFAWDEEKNQDNITRHGLDFADAWSVFDSPLIARLDTREDYGEDRWQGIGMLQGRVVVIVFTERDPDIIRIISLRKADREERRTYEQAIQNELGTG
jgi:uncharacterized DUF497 family protein